MGMKLATLVEKRQRLERALRRKARHYCEIKAGGKKQSQKPLVQKYLERVKARSEPIEPYRKGYIQELIVSSILDKAVVKNRSKIATSESAIVTWIPAASQNVKQSVADAATTWLPAKQGREWKNATYERLTRREKMSGTLRRFLQPLFNPSLRSKTGEYQRMLREFIYDTCAHIEKLTGRRVGISRPASGGPVHGPGLDLVKATVDCVFYPMPTPGRDFIAKEIKAYKRPSTEHVRIPGEPPRGRKIRSFSTNPPKWRASWFQPRWSDGVKEIIDGNHEPVTRVLEEPLKEMREEDALSNMAPLRLSPRARQQLKRTVKDLQIKDGTIVGEFDRESEESRKGVQKVFTALRDERTALNPLSEKERRQALLDALQRAGKSEEAEKIKQLWKQN
jgi:hypothetical protein